MTLFNGWDISVQKVELAGCSLPLCKREAGLMMLNFIHYLLRRSSLGDEGGRPATRVTKEQIVLGCLKAVYVEGLSIAQHVLPVAIVNM